MALPLPLRNRLADLILDALHDPQARQALEVVVAVCVESGGVPAAQSIPNAFPADLFEHREGVWRLKGAWKAYEVEFAERAERARGMLRRRAFDPADPPSASPMLSKLYLVDDQGEIGRRRPRMARGQLVEAWPDLFVRGEFWMGERSKALLDEAGPPLPAKLAVEDSAVPVYYGPRLAD